MKFPGKVGNWPMNKWLNFGGDPYPAGGIWIRIATLVRRALTEVRTVPVLLVILLVVVMVALWNRADHYIFMLFLLSSFFFLFLFPRLISAVRDWMSTILPHMVWP